MDASFTSLRHSHHRRENPSFSSSLLDAIYRSIDAGEDDYSDDRDFVFYREETMRKKQSSGSNNKVSSSSTSSSAFSDEKSANIRRACMIEKWMEKKVEVRPSHRNVVLMNSSSSSSESSSNGGFSSSESESLRRPKPIRTTVSAPASEKSHHKSAPKPKPGLKHSSLDGFVKTKSRALKIYGELKKAKQPISPGGRLASFLNSIFANASPRKPKPASTSTTCSSASSFSRSCLSSSSTNKFGDSGSSAKRSVRFGAVSVFVGGDEKSRVVDERDRRRVQEVAIDLLKSYQKKSSANDVVVAVEEFDMRDVADVYENDNDDVSSCSSSDLFELDNLSAIGMDYTQELPVYETTHFDTNRAIANGLIL